MVTDYIVEFTSYLNAHDDGFAITNEKISRFFEMMANENLDFTNAEDILGIMKTVFCDSYKQYILIESYFHYFLQDKKGFQQFLLLEQQRKQWQNMQAKFSQTYIDQKQSYKQSINHLNQIMNNEMQDIQMKVYNNKEKYIDISLPKIKDIKFSRKEKTFMADIINYQGQLNNLDLTCQQQQLMKSIFINHDKDELYEYDMKEYEDIRNKIVYETEKTLMENNIERFEQMEQLFHIFDKLMKHVKHQNKLQVEAQNQINEQLDSIVKEKQDAVRLFYQQKRNTYNEMLNQLDNQRFDIQIHLNQINKQIKTLQSSKMIVKDLSMSHRDEFIGGQNAVITYNIDEQTTKLFAKSFDSLTHDEKDSIYYYIKKNIMSFKTRMSRQIYTNERKIIDMQSTIQNTFKTCGLPFSIYFLKPKPNKTKLILILDVSGSCQEASQMMLTFMYILKSVFPKGCQIFAFVNTLYDISNVIESSDIETSVEHALKLIPRQGVYSSYYEPFKSLWEDHRRDITSDSIVIVIGDGRNNNHPTGEEFIKNIVRRVKKAYWLNTESVDKWDQADSLASLYGKYFKMYEILNTGDLIEFIETIG